jgi:uncharacterized protein YcfJ
MLVGVAVIGLGVAVIGFGVAFIGPAAVLSGARRLAESVTKAPIDPKARTPRKRCREADAPERLESNLILLTPVLTTGLGGIGSARSGLLTQDA